MDSFSVASGPLAAPSSSWIVLSVVGEEAISSTYWFDVVVAFVKDGVTASWVEHALARASVSFRIGQTGLSRHGIVASATLEGTRSIGTGTSTSHGPPHLVVRLRVVPRLWLLNHRRTTRIFQGKYVHEIVTAVLARYGIRHRWDLRNTYRKRLYCTQYEETDLAFVSRILAEEGIFFFFEHPWPGDDGDTESSDGDGDSGSSTQDKVASGIGAAASAASTAGSLTGSRALSLGGSIGALAADLVKPAAADDEDDAPKVIGAGAAGPTGGETFWFVDNAGSYLQPAVPLHLRDVGGAISDPSDVVELQSSESVAPLRSEVRDYDFRRPLLALVASSGDDGAGPDPQTDLPLEVYAHHGEYDKPDVDTEMATVHLEQYRARVKVTQGKSGSAGLVAGGCFRLENSTVTPFDEGTYAVVRVRHESYTSALSASVPDAASALEPLVIGCADAIDEALWQRRDLSRAAVRDILHRALSSPPGLPPAYQNRFECVPIDVPYRPPRPKRVMRTVTESATVVGPTKASGGDGQEIYLDKYGRVKLQFHWDRDGKWDDNSSCWVRVAQTWAGPGFGFQFFPRVGMEVLVTYLGGDPDRPVVVGALHNATHPTTEPLPDRMTRSGIRTQTSPGGGGFNELSFEDAKDTERIYLHAQKDLDEVVNDAHRMTVVGAQTIDVGDARTVSVVSDDRLSVGGNRTQMVAGNETTAVTGSQSARVSVNRAVEVDGHDKRDVAGNAVDRVGGDAVSVVEGDQNLVVHKNVIAHVGGAHPDATSNAIVYVQGSAFVTTTKHTVVKAGEAGGDASSSSIRLECGHSSISITSDTITLSAPTVKVNGSDTVQLARAGDPQHNIPPKILLMNADQMRLFADPVLIESKQSRLKFEGGDASLIGSSTAKIESPAISFRSGSTSATADAGGDSASTTNATLTLQFTFKQPGSGGTKITNTKCRVVVGKHVKEGQTDGSGVVSLQLPIPDDEKVASVTLWANETFGDYFPADEGPLHWLVDIAESWPAHTETKGALMRLANLGYDPSRDIEAHEIDDVTKDAVNQFRGDNDMDTDDDDPLDDDTKTKIHDLYGS